MAHSIGVPAGHRVVVGICKPVRHGWGGRGKHDFKIEVVGIPSANSPGYLYLHQLQKRQLMMDPFKLSRAIGTPKKFQLEITRIGKEKKSHYMGKVGNMVILVTGLLISSPAIWRLASEVG